jgi:glutaredoxin
MTGYIAHGMTSRAEHPRKTSPAVTIYSKRGCGRCILAKDFFRQCGIAADVVDFDEASPDLRRSIASEIRAHGSQGFPFVKIDERVAPEYSPEQYGRLLGDKAACPGGHGSGPSSAGESADEDETADEPRCGGPACSVH